MPAPRDQALDAGQRGVVADRVDPDPQRGVGRHGAGHHPVARPSSATGRDSPVIIDSSSSARAVDDRAVGRHPAAGAHQHDVAELQLIQRN